MENLQKIISEIEDLDREIYAQSKGIWDTKVKPLGSLGKMETLVMQVNGILGTITPEIDKKAIAVFCGDNGVYEENISSSPQAFTALLTEATAKGLTGVATLSRYVKSDVFVVDVGLSSDVDHPNVLNKKVAYGTKNFVKEPAMSKEEVLKAINVGIEMADKLDKDGYTVFGVGELGIANTTTSAAVLAGLTGLTADIVCGVGGGITKEQLQNKVDTVQKGIDLHLPSSLKKEALDVLQTVGGLDIASMAGFYIGCAKNKKPVIMDGFISTVAALVAVKMAPLVKSYIIPSHLSHEKGAVLVLEALEMQPFLTMDMRLGEGSACPLIFQILDAGVYTFHHMGSFEEAAIDSRVLLDMRKKAGE